ncbi:KilA-N domain-containing protein [Burkholderia gladioli]|uniref:KilA-N domain-containing protein n=1 Tax=Burkholderia gladioli TaxID=28095 RepID=UPI000CFF3573|nr:KilA-N domain-containing protein [Burkholderia gladioli]PRG49761.1 DNA-binding protein [Burkholderia gladioli]
MSQHQFSLELIQRNVNGGVIEQRASDGYINATQLCHIANKRWYNYLRNESSGQFLRALSTQTQIRVSELNQEVIDNHGVKSTWVHPQVAINLAQWLSPEFAVQVSQWIYDWMSGKAPTPVRTQLPYHLERHMKNLAKIPSTHFSILQEMSLTLLGPLEAHGYSLPERLVPDISQGRMFCDFLRKHSLADPSLLPTYQHEFPDGRVVDAKLYPLELLGHFRKFIAETWMPKRAAAYFKDRDPHALPYLDRVLALPAPAPKTHTVPQVTA